MEDRSDDENDGFYYYYSGIFHFLAMKIPFYFWLILIVAIIWYLIVLRVFCWSGQPTSPNPSQDQLATRFDWSTPSTSPSTMFDYYFIMIIIYNCAQVIKSAKDEIYFEPKSVYNFIGIRSIVRSEV